MNQSWKQLTPGYENGIVRARIRPLFPVVLWKTPHRDPCRPFTSPLRLTLLGHPAQRGIHLNTRSGVLVQFLSVGRETVSRSLELSPVDLDPSPFRTGLVHPGYGNQRHHHLWKRAIDTVRQCILSHTILHPPILEPCPAGMAICKSCHQRPVV